jgi:hypothetical protein
MHVVQKAVCRQGCGTLKRNKRPKMQNSLWQPRIGDINGIRTGFGGTPAVAGVYYGGAMHNASSLGQGVRSIGYYDDASANHGESGMGLGKMFEHGTLSLNAGLISQINGKIWNCDWHTQLYEGVAALSLGGVSEVATGITTDTEQQPGMPGTTCSSVPATTILAVYHFNYLLSKARLQFEAFRRDPVVHRPIGQRGVAAINPFERISRLTDAQDIIWSNKAIANDDARFRQLALTYEIPAGDVLQLQQCIQEAYKVYPNLCWCNSFYVADYVKSQGIIKSSFVSDRRRCVDVSVVIRNNAECLGYWPTAKPHDYVGFVLTRVGKLFGAEVARTDQRFKTLIMVPWTSPSSQVALESDFPFNRIAQVDRADAVRGTFTYCLGKLLRTDDLAWLGGRSMPYENSVREINSRAFAFVGISPSNGEPIRDMAADISKKTPMTMVVSLHSNTAPSFV